MDKELKPGQQCYETARAAEKLKTGKPGDMITREEMAEHIGISCEIGTKGYGNVRSAIQHVQNLHGIVWGWCRTAKAWKCLNEHEKLELATKGKERSYRSAGRANHVLALVNDDGLTIEEQRTRKLTAAMLGMMRMAGSAAFAKQLEAKNSGPPKLPSAHDVAKLMTQRDET